MVYRARERRVQSDDTRTMEKLNQIFSATYSGVDVYELILVTGSVMRRKRDGWVNATHILKAADFPKAKRTRILERDVQVGEHEKVQGGYGKYQGTWVPVQRAREIAKEFEVDSILAPLFDLESTKGANSPPPAPKHHHASKNNSMVVKPAKAVATRKTTARRTASVPVKKSKPDDDMVLPAANAEALKKRGRPRRLNAPVSNPNKGVFVGNRMNSSLEKTPSSVQWPSNDINENEDDDDEAQESLYLRDISLNDGLSSEIDENDNLNLVSSSSPSEFMSDTDLANALRSPNQRINQSARESLERAISSHNSHIRSSSAEDKWFDTNAEYISRLLEYFMAPDDGRIGNNTTTSLIPEFILNPPKTIDFDKVIDEDGHTLFHWACSMGDAEVVEAWINLGVNYRVINKYGETPLMRSVLFTNSFNKKTFPKLVELLGETIFEIDSTNKSVLHHIANAPKNRIPSAYYYMDILLAKVSAQSFERLSGILNLRDNNGDTALHLCAKNANRKCIKLLLEFKAKHNLKNNQGLIASDILLKNDKTPKIQQRYELHLKNQREAAEQERFSRIQQGIEPPSPQQQQKQYNDQFKTPFRFAEPHVSEAAIEATHKVTTFLVESLNGLSHAYDTELQRKEADGIEVEELLHNMDEDIRSTKLKTVNLLGEQLTDAQIQDRLKLLDNEVKRHKKLMKQKEIKLKRLFERSQKKKLEKLVSQYEREEEYEVNKYKDYTYYDKLKDIVELTKLQLNRKRLIYRIISTLGDKSNGPKMQKYKKLISAASDVDIDQVESKLDELLQEIENNA